MKTKIYGALLIVFLSGLCAGFFGGQYYDRARVHYMMQRGPEHFEAMLMERLARQLDLDKAQKPEIRAKVVVVVNEMDAEFRQRGDGMRARMMRLLTEIRPLLNAAQQNILDRMDVDDLRPGPPPPHDGHRPPPPSNGQEVDD